MDRRDFIKAATVAGVAATTNLLSIDLARAAAKGAETSDPPAGAKRGKRFLTIGSNRYFTFEDGQAFLPLGGFYGNFVHEVKDGVIQAQRFGSIRQSSEKQKRAWFQALADNGVNCLRIMSRDHAKRGVDEWDIVGAVNGPLLAEWEKYWRIALEYGIYILPTIHESFYATYSPYRNRGVMKNMVLPLYSKEELAKLPAYRRRLLEGKQIDQPMDMYSDPDIVKAREDYVNALILRLRDNPSILFYELENEQATGIYDWTNMNIDWIRRHDAKTPICISHSGEGLLTADPIPHTRRTKIDFYSWHVYPVGRASTKEFDYGLAVSMLSRYANMGVPAGPGEACSDAIARDCDWDWRRALARDVAWYPFLSGCNAVLFWDAPQPEVEAFKVLSEIVGMLPLGTLKRKRPAIAVDVSHSLADDLYFRSDEGYRTYTTMGQYEEHFADLGVEFDYTLDGNGYKTVLDGHKFTDFSPPARPFVLSEGYQLRHLTAHDDSICVAYIRNRGDYVHIGKGWRSGWVRKPKTADFELEVNLNGSYEGFFHDFNTGVRRAVAFKDKGVFREPSKTDHDFLLFLARV